MREENHYALLTFNLRNSTDFSLRNNPEVQQEYWAAWPIYVKALQEAGVLVGGAGLQSPDTATTLDLSHGQKSVQDGPIADTKEQLGGFFIIDVPDLDTAMEWASRCPLTPGRKVEIRPNLPPVN